MTAIQSPPATGTFPSPVIPFESEAARLIRNISRLAALAASPETLVPSVIQEIAAASTTSEVSLTLRNPVTGEVWQAAALPGGRATTEFSLDLEVRGIRYGHLDLRTTGNATASLEVAQTLAEQLARYAELQAERTRHEHLIAFGRVSEQQLRRQKLVARASGILVSERGMSEFQVHSWLETEARRQRRSVNAVAEQVIAESSQANWLKATA